MSLALPSDNSPDPRLRKYKAGQSILCLVLQAEKDGYTAYVDGSVPAFLHTKTELKPGDEVFAKVVSISNRVLLTDRNEPTNVTFSDSDKQPKFNFPKFNEQFEQYLTQTEADRGGSGQPPRKTALGYSGDCLLYTSEFHPQLNDVHRFDFRDGNHLLIVQTEQIQKFTSDPRHVEAKPFDVQNKVASSDVV